jgi:hypothetical protein
MITFEYLLQLIRSIYNIYTNNTGRRLQIIGN